MKTRFCVDCHHAWLQVSECEPEDIECPTCKHSDSRICTVEKCICERCFCNMPVFKATWRKDDET